MKNIKHPNSQRGDTLIEVLVAITILSMVVVTAQSIMNYGQSLALRSVERTAAQASVNAQFSYLRYARNESMGSGSGLLWDAIKSKALSTPPSDATVCNPTQPRPFREDGMFYINEATAMSAIDAPSLANAVVDYPTVTVGGVNQPVAATDAPEPGKGIWLVARSGGDASVGTAYIDFYAKACWTPLVGSNMEQLTSVMRLYVP